MANANAEDRLQAVQARLDAVKTVLDSLLSALLVRGVLSKAELEQILQSSEAALQARATHSAALEQVAAIRQDIPEHLRSALGPEPDEDDHDH
jgi:hypothetical protein